MNNILLYLSNGLIIGAFIIYGFNIIFNNKKLGKKTGFDVTKDIISKYDSINVIETTGKLSYYNIKRGVIRLNTSCYYGNDVSHLALSLIEAGISGIDREGNKYINFFKKIISNLKILYLFPVLVVIINCSVFTRMDAKFDLLLVILSSIFMYIYCSILSMARDWIITNFNNIKSYNSLYKDKIISYINNVLTLNNLVFLGELISIVRIVAILIDFSV